MDEVNVRNLLSYYDHGTTVTCRTAVYYCTLLRDIYSSGHMKQTFAITLSKATCTPARSTSCCSRPLPLTSCYVPQFNFAVTQARPTVCYISLVLCCNKFSQPCRYHPICMYMYKIIVVRLSIHLSVTQGQWKQSDLKTKDAGSLATDS